MKKNVIFDADGVLFLSTELGINTLIKSIGVCGLQKPTFDDLRLMWGCRLEAELMPLLSQKLNWTNGAGKQVVDLFLDLSNYVIYPTQLGLIKSLESLIKKGYQLGIVTNRDAKGLFWRLGQQGIDTNLFCHIQTPCSGFYKPDPRVFRHFWHKFGFNPNETLYVGDSIVYDLEVTRQHTPVLAFAGIVSGLHTRVDFMQAGVPETNIFNNVVELSAMLTNL